MLGRLAFLLLLIVPLIEISLFVVIGQAIGLWPTLLGIIVLAIIGSTIIRHQGLKLLLEIRSTMGRGQLPARALADAMLVTIAGVFMVVPGYFTDFLGLLLLIPPLRSALYLFLLHRLKLRPAAAAASTQGTSGPRVIELDQEHFRSP
jgi:UPF0716 protein FxsA